MSESITTPGDLVELRVPASSVYLVVLRTTTASLAARQGFTLDDIEDLRIAVDEACAILLPMAEPGAALECRFELRTDQLNITVSVPAPSGEVPGRDTFAWTVLSALAGDVDASAADGRVTIELRKQRV